jgi:hypothetical protein
VRERLAILDKDTHERLGQPLEVLRLRRADHEDPSDAIPVYLGMADEILEETDRRAYTRAVRLLKRARSAPTPPASATYSTLACLAGESSTAAGRP